MILEPAEDPVCESSMTRYWRFRGGYSMIWRRPCPSSSRIHSQRVGDGEHEAGGLDQVGRQEAGLLRIHEAVVAGVQALMPDLGGWYSSSHFM